MTGAGVAVGAVPREGWGRVLAPAYAEARTDEPVIRDGHVVAATCDGRVIGAIAAERVYCVSPLWVARDWRGTHLGVALARIITGLNTEGWREVLCTTNPHVELLAHNEGFIPVEGVMFRRG